MRVLNIIEQNDDNILSCISFLVPEAEPFKKFKIKEAEDCFIQCAIENGMKKEDSNSAIEDGYFSIDDGSYAVKLIWSDPVK